jgi:3-isopropylmalate dehydrogenase
MQDIRIAVLEGDDVGKEIIPATLSVLYAACKLVNLNITWIDLLMGVDAHNKYGDTFPKETEEKLNNVIGIIAGPIGHNTYPRNDPSWRIPPLRKKFEMFASVKPIHSYKNIESYKKDIDIIFVREVTEGLLSSETIVAGSAEYRPNDEITISSRVITRKGAHRVAKEAFKIAKYYDRKKVTAAHKEPVYRLSCGMFIEECRKVSLDFPNIIYDEKLIDTTAMHLVTSPEDFDVVVTTNQFGDILTDLGAGLVGSLGLAPGLCIGEDKAMAQATHGSAPDIAGRDIANPYALIVSSAMLLDWIGNKFNIDKANIVAKKIKQSVDTVIESGINITKDIGGTSGTKAMTKAIIDNLK